MVNHQHQPQNAPFRLFPPFVTREGIDSFLYAFDAALAVK